MKIVTFKARDMREALNEVKSRLGPDAVILSTRSVRERGRGGLPTGSSMIEVTACPNPSAGGESAEATTAAPGAREESAPQRPPAAPAAEKKAGRFSVVADDPVELTPLSRQNPAEEILKRRGASQPKRPRASGRQIESAGEAIRGWSKGESTPEEIARALGRPMEGGARKPLAGGSKLVQARNLSEDLSDVRSTLAELETRVNINMPTGFNEVTGLDAEGKKRYGWLLMHGVEEPIARKLAQTEQSDKDNRGLDNALKRFLKFHDPLNGNARVIVLVGPTGVGKTTTLAKAAANLILNRGRSVGFITLDTFRVGAVAQLETYAKLLQVRMVVARSLSEVKAGVQSLNRCDFILVDTVGSSPYNRRQVNSTGGLLPVMGDNREVLLCMAGNVRETEQQAIFRRFSTLNPTGLVFTKLDETVTYGGILNVALRARLPLTLYTDGQRVPENLGWLSAKTMAKWFEQQVSV